MSAIYHDEIEIEDFDFDEATETYHYPCPCGDRFEITKEELSLGEEVATCPSCSLVLKVIYNKKIIVYEKWRAEDEDRQEQRCWRAWECSGLRCISSPTTKLRRLGLVVVMASLLPLFSLHFSSIHFPYPGLHQSLSTALLSSNSTWRE
ncbi:Zinc finger DPH-type [Trinorchestia longiramus]|nr:Zinc finger DPH-type [Trinorchestia longiramus]